MSERRRLRGKQRSRSQANAHLLDDQVEGFGRSVEGDLSGAALLVQHLVERVVREAHDVLPEGFESLLPHSHVGHQLLLVFLELLERVRLLRQLAGRVVHVREYRQRVCTKSERAKRLKGNDKVRTVHEEGSDERPRCLSMSFARR